MFDPPPDVSAAFYADPSGRFKYRYWDGDRWTDQVTPGDGTMRADPVQPDGWRERFDGEPMWDEMRDALAAYSRLVDDANAKRIDEATFRREAVKVGIIVGGENAWIIDLVNQQWHHYDGMQLRTLQITDRQG